MKEPSNKDSKDKKRDVYHDTELLLKKYRNAVLSLKESQQAHRSFFEEEFGVNITEYLEQLYVAGMETDFTGGTKHESHARTMNRTNKLLKRIDRAVEIMAQADNANPKKSILYAVLYHTFMSKQEIKSVSDIIVAINESIDPNDAIDNKAYYRWRIKAIKTLSEVLWGYTTRDMLEITDTFFDSEL